MKKFLALVLFAYPSLANSQSVPDNHLTGIQFEKGLTWSAVKAKAKREKKYVFVDCYTTWCGPCKLMEKEVYPDTAVGNYFNAHFISVKFQMDKTDKDDDATKAWYADADAIQKQYGVAGYPTFFFFSPKGKLTNRDLGYKNAYDLLTLAQKSAKADFAVPYKQFYADLKNYRKGKKDFSIMPALMDTARMVGIYTVADSISADYIKYLQDLPEDQLYTKSNIAFLASYIKGSRSKFLKLFYPDGAKTDGIMNQPGYSKIVVDRIIMHEDIHPFLHIPEGGMAYSGGLPRGPQPDWKKLTKIVADKYPGEDYPDRLILLGHVQWEEGQQDWGECAKWFTKFATKYPQPPRDEQTLLFINGMCDGVIFQRSVDKDQIDAAIMIMKNLLTTVKEMNEPATNYIDTYANLLYKADRKEEALEWEQKAVQSARDLHEPQEQIDAFLETINKMKKGDETWPHYL